jgi:cobalamin synthase
VTAPALAVATVLAAAAAIALAGVPHGLAALLAAALTAGLVTVWANAMLGGRTGDSLGATVALAEAIVAAVLLGFTAN